MEGKQLNGEELLCITIGTDRDSKRITWKKLRRHLDWFREIIETLEPRFHRRERLYAKYLSSMKHTGKFLLKHADLFTRQQEQQRMLGFSARLRRHRRSILAKGLAVYRGHAKRVTWVCPYQVSNYQGENGYPALQLTHNIKGVEGTSQMYLAS